MMWKYLFTRVATAAVLALACGVTGCASNEGGPVRQEDSSPTAEWPAVKGTMMATVNGDQWSSGGSPSETKLDDVTASVDPNTGMVTINGRKYIYHAMKADNLEEISLTVKTLAPGVYRLGPDFNNFQTATFTRGFSQPTTFFIQEKQTGTVTITRIDSLEHRVFGTFTFTCRDSKGHDMTIENGTFDNVHFDSPVLASSTEGQ